MRQINDHVITQDMFAFDGCHKFYLIETPEDERTLRDYGYEIYPIDYLPLAWNDSCPLRFILSADLDTTYVGQGEPAWFTGWPIEKSLQRDLDELARLQEHDNGTLRAHR